MNPATQPKIRKDEPDKDIITFYEQQAFFRNDSTLIIENKQSQVEQNPIKNHELNARDYLVFFPFHFQFQLQIIPESETKDPSNSNNISRNLRPTSVVFAKLLQKIHRKLVTIVENVFSISFKFTFQELLKENETKALIAKILLNNVHEIMYQTFRAIKGICIQGKEQQYRRIRVDLTKEIDIILRNITGYLAQAYPQSKPTGATAYMRSLIIPIDKSYNEKYYFGIAKDIELVQQSDPIKVDYTDYIMQVINRILQITEKNNEMKIKQKGDKDQDQILNITMFELFKDFNSNILQVAQNQKFNQLLKNQQISKKMINYLQNPYSQNNKKQFLDSKDYKLGLSQSKNTYQNIQTSQKLPKYLRKFTKKQIKQKNFKADHSAVLRVLTKWAEGLQNVFSETLRYSFLKQYPFYNLQLQEIFVSQQKKQQIVNQFQEKQCLIKQYKKKLVNENIQLASLLLSTKINPQTQLYLNKNTQPRIIACNIYANLVHLMIKYLSKLIHTLLQVGKIEETTCIYQQVEKDEQKVPVQIKIQHTINFIFLKFGDLLRSRIQCDQKTFIKIMSLLYFLDKKQRQSNKEPKFFEIMQIKNKLDEDSSNVFIIYLFKGQILCELQLSIKYQSEKQKLYYEFAHLLYEISREKFGVFTALSTMMVQADQILNKNNVRYRLPSVNYKHNYQKCSYEEDKVEKHISQILKDNKKQVLCSVCRKLKRSEGLNINQNQKYIFKKCYDCKLRQIIQKQKQTLKKSLQILQLGNQNSSIKNKENYKFQKILKMTELSGLRSYTQNTNLDSAQGKLDVFVYNSQKKDKHYVAVFDQKRQIFQKCCIYYEFNSRTWIKIFKSKSSQEQEYQFEQIDPRRTEDLVFQFSLDVTQQYQEALKYRQIVDKKDIEVQQKNALKKIMRKTQSIQVYNTGAFQLNQKFDKQQYDNIKYISFSYSKLQSLPGWIENKQFKNLLQLNISSNKLKDISQVFNYQHLRTLIADDTLIEKINVTNNKSLVLLSLRKNYRMEQLYLQNFEKLKVINLTINPDSISQRLTIKQMQNLQVLDVEVQLQGVLKKHGVLKVKQDPKEVQFAINAQINSQSLPLYYQICKENEQLQSMQVIDYKNNLQQEKKLNIKHLFVSNCGKNIKNTLIKVYCRKIPKWRRIQLEGFLKQKTAKQQQQQQGSHKSGYYYNRLLCLHLNLPDQIPT